MRDAVAATRRITPAGEWLLDNFYLIEEQIRTAKRHLPQGYSRELPRLAHGPSAGLPRVYDIALEAISHGDGHINAESLHRFVAAYQQVAPLKLGELWAVPIMLRLALIENLRRVAAHIAENTINRNRANYWADLMIETAEKDAEKPHSGDRGHGAVQPPMVSSFVAELARRLQGRSAALALPLTWVEQRLSESDSTIEQLVQWETQEQAADQVSISNSIGSLRLLGAIDWREFVETKSVVEQKLREDPALIYAKMDFATRDRYRHATERLAKKSDLSELEVARKAIQLAHEGAAAHGSDERTAHVGYYLIDRGLEQLEKATATRQSTLDLVQQALSRSTLPCYLGAIAALTAAVTASLLVRAHALGVHYGVLAATGVAAAILASQFAVALVNWLATLFTVPVRLPRMDFSAGIPPAASTLVAVPTMLVSTKSIEELAEDLEVRFLANRQRNLYFALLTDFRDAPQETMPDDELLVRCAPGEQITALNAKYSEHADAEAGGVFFLFHRPRRWNPQERMWMGYERKRGKLADLNALLRGGGGDRFSLVVGDIQNLPRVKYVITVDTDTRLPRDSAREPLLPWSIRCIGHTTTPSAAASPKAMPSCNPA